MSNEIKKYFGLVFTFGSGIILISDLANLITIDNLSIKIFLLAIIMISLPISIYSIIALRAFRRKVIEIENINLITINHEFAIRDELIKRTKKIEIQSVDYIYEFQGRDFTSIRTYKGKSKSFLKKISGFPLVVAGDSNAAFSEINCFAYDLKTDGAKTRKLYPTLLSCEGLYKFASYTFAQPLNYNQDFSIECHYTWPDCVSPEKDYILVSPIFGRKAFDRFNVELRFRDIVPIRVKKYLIDAHKKVTFMGEVVRDFEQKSSQYISFTDAEVEMKENIAFYVYIYDFEK